uniref:TIGR03013 family PEP-CTERM/XrtA system glycosyltransferase n=1 Tax=Desulfacinum infernum TaxID=35837 RepID=A0A831ZTY1_9BACT
MVEWSMLRLFHTYYPIRNLIFFLGEGFLIFVALWVGMLLRAHGLFLEDAPRHSVWIRVLVVTVVVQLSLYYHDLYTVARPLKMSDLFLRLMQATGAACIVLAGLYYLYPPIILEQGAFFVALFLLLLLLVSWRFGYQYMCLKGIGSEKVFLVGAGRLAHLIVSEIAENLDSGYKVEAVLDREARPELAHRFGLEYYDDYDRMCELAVERKVSKIIVALDEKRGKFPAEALLRCRMAGIPIFDGVTFYEALSGKILVEGALPSWLIYSDGFHRHRWTQLCKRAVDIVFASAGLLLSAPLMACIALAVKWDSSGPVFYTQERVGQKEKPFRIVKFRTMVQNAERLSGPVWAEERDPRITRVGRVLRKLRLDELPQFWNVLRGDMSFVGPRPERPVFVQALKKRIPYYGERHTVKPGITGWAQVNYPYGASEEDALKKMEYDLFYVKNFTILMDLYVILKTVQIVLFGRGAR